MEIPAQFNRSESKVIQDKRIEEEDEGQPPPNVVIFPAAREDADDATSHSSEKVLEATKQVAAILKLTESDALMRVVADYVHDPGISLLGEADAAREWIDDPTRNHKRQRLTPAFFRRWLQREQESYHRRHTQTASPPGSSIPSSTSPGQRVVSGAGPPGSSSTPVDDPYHAFVEQRARALLQSMKGGDHAQTS